MFSFENMSTKAAAQKPQLVPFFPPDNKLDSGLLGAPTDTVISVQNNVALLKELVQNSDAASWSARPDVLDFLRSYLRHRSRSHERGASDASKPASDVVELDEWAFRALNKLLRSPSIITSGKIDGLFLLDVAALFGPSNANATAAMINAAVEASPSSLVRDLHGATSTAVRLLTVDVPKVIAVSAGEAASEITPDEAALVNRVNDVLSFTADIVCSLAQLLTLVPAAALAVGNANDASNTSPSCASNGTDGPATAVSLLNALADTYEHTLPALLALVAFCNKEFDNDESDDGEASGTSAAASADAQFNRSDAFSSRQRRLALALGHGCLAAGHALLDSCFLAPLGIGWSRALPAVEDARRLAAATSGSSGSGSGNAGDDDPISLSNKLTGLLSGLKNYEATDHVASAAAGRPVAAHVLRSTRHASSGSYLRDMAKVFSLYQRITRLRQPALSGAQKERLIDDDHISYIASLVLEKEEVPKSSSAANGASSTSAAPTPAQIAAVREVLPLDEATIIRALKLAGNNVEGAIERLLASGAADGAAGTSTGRGDRFDDGLRARTLALVTQQQEEEERLAEEEAAAAAAAEEAKHPVEYVPIVSGKAGRKAAKSAAAASSSSSAHKHVVVVRSEDLGGGGGGGVNGQLTLDYGAEPGLVAVEREGLAYDDEYDDVYDDYEKVAIGKSRWDSDEDDDGGEGQDGGDGSHGASSGAARRGAGRGVAAFSSTSASSSSRAPGPSAGGRGGTRGAGVGSRSTSASKPQSAGSASSSGSGFKAGNSGGAAASRSAIGGRKPLQLNASAPSFTASSKAVVPSSSSGGRPSASGSAASSAAVAPTSSSGSNRALVPAQIHGRGPAQSALHHDDDDEDDDDEEEEDEDESDEGGGGNGGSGARGGRGGGRGGRGGFRGGGGGPVTGHGPRAQGGLTEAQAARKRENKARSGNHNRKRGADKKLAKAMI